MADDGEWDGRNRRAHCADHCATIKGIRGAVQFRVFAAAMSAVLVGVGIFAAVYTGNINDFEVAIKDGFTEVRFRHDKDLEQVHAAFLREVQMIYRVAEANGSELKRGAEERARMLALQEVVLRTIKIGNGRDKSSGRRDP